MEMKLLSFDIEDWFHLLDLPEVKDFNTWDKFPTRIEPNLIKILDLLKTYEFDATFFCVGWIAERYPELIRLIHDAGYEIASHTYAHQLIYQQTQSEFEYDLKKSIDVLETITGEKVRGFRAPGFSITPASKWALRLLIEAGIEYDSSLVVGKHSHGGFQSAPHDGPFTIVSAGQRLFEFPIQPTKVFLRRFVFSGGGYFRAIPLPILMHLFRNHSYIMSYFHPRDFDKDQPILKMSISRKFKAYYGLAGCFSKLQKISSSYDFSSIRENIQTIDWDRRPTFEI